MVRFAAPKLPANRRTPSGGAANNFTSQQVQLNRIRNAPGRPVRLPSLYPTISLNALSNNSQPSEQGLQRDNDSPRNSFGNCSNDCTLNEEAKEERYVNNRYRVEESGVQQTKVKGTPLYVGAASVLRAATAFAAGEDAAEDTVQKAEDSIEKPKITVRT